MQLFLGQLSANDVDGVAICEAVGPCIERLSDPQVGARDDHWRPWQGWRAQRFAAQAGEFLEEFLPGRLLLHGHLVQVQQAAAGPLNDRELAKNVAISEASRRAGTLG